MRFIAKPMPGYSQHYVGDTCITATGRECVVDESQASFMVDEPGKPLKLSKDGYAHFRGLFGVSLVCEPIGGATGEEAARRISELEAKVAELEAQLAAKTAKK